MTILFDIVRVLVFVVGLIMLYEIMLFLKERKEENGNNKTKV